MFYSWSFIEGVDRWVLFPFNHFHNYFRFNCAVDCTVTNCHAASEATLHYSIIEYYHDLCATTEQSESMEKAKSLC